MTPFWLTAFLDFAPEHHAAGVDFWSRATSYDVSARRGADGEFATLVPPDGDDYLRVQRLGDGPDRLHLDLHVADPRAAAADAVDRGASEQADHGGYVVMSSPGGLPFCFVTRPAAVRPGPTSWPGGHASMLDQVCIDVPASSYDVEERFWSEVLDREPIGSISGEFRRLRRPDGQPLEVLMQRLDEETGATRAHFDWATTDRDAEVERHVGLGAGVVRRYEGWTVLADPVGNAYCITVREPS